MIERLKIVIQKLSISGQQGRALSDEENRMAAVALLVEVMMADSVIEDSEKEQLAISTMTLLNLTREESEQLIERAVKKHKELVSLYDLTSVINQQYDQAGKFELITHMWRVAYSDQQWDKYEEHIIRKVADLLYISHQDFVRAKVVVQEQVSQP